MSKLITIEIDLAFDPKMRRALAKKLGLGGDMRDETIQEWLLGLIEDAMIDLMQEAAS